jgi:hypothetical protein
VHGTIAAGQLAPAVYTTSIRTGQEEYEVRMVFSGGNCVANGCPDHLRSESA